MNKKLVNLPFDSFNEVKIAYENKFADIGVTRKIIAKWTQKGVDCPKQVKNVSLFLVLIPYIAIIAYFIYILTIKKWLYLLYIPLFLISVHFFHPSSRFKYGIYRHLAIIILIYLTIKSIINSDYLTLFISINFLLIWLSQKIYYKYGRKKLIKQALIDEELFNYLWDTNNLSIYFNNVEYYRNYFIFNGQVMYYEDI